LVCSPQISDVGKAYPLCSMAPSSASAESNLDVDYVLVYRFSPEGNFGSLAMIELLWKAE
jgi:hypothetical protein